MLPPTGSPSAAALLDRGSRSQSAPTDARVEPARDGAVAEPSLSSSFEHLLAGSQGVVAKRIELALLEGQHLFSRAIEDAALMAVAALLAAGAWFAAAGAFSQLMFPEASLALRLLVAGLVNAAGALSIALLALQRGRAMRRSGTPRAARST